jgi:nitrogenase subunit NifH
MDSITVDVDLDNVIDELESRGYTVCDPGTESDNVETIKEMEDDIYNLYQDFICWKDLGMKDSTFENILKLFFEKHTDKIVA